MFVDNVDILYFSNLKVFVVYDFPGIKDLKQLVDTIQLSNKDLQIFTERIDHQSSMEQVDHNNDHKDNVSSIVQEKRKILTTEPVHE